MNTPKQPDGTLLKSTALFSVHPASHMAQRIAGERFYRRKTPREGGTTNCHSCGVEISQSALCPSCWHKRAFPSANVKEHTPAPESEGKQTLKGN